VKKKITWVK